VSMYYVRKISVMKYYRGAMEETLRNSKESVSCYLQRSLVLPPTTHFTEKCVNSSIQSGRGHDGTIRAIPSSVQPGACQDDLCT
jgi:hypothetical protein